MSVKELIYALQQFKNQDAPVTLAIDNFTGAAFRRVEDTRIEVTEFSVSSYADEMVVTLEGEVR